MGHRLPTDVLKELNKLSYKILQLFYKRSIQSPKRTIMQTTVKGAVVNITTQHVMQYYKQYPEKFL